MRAELERPRGAAGAESPPFGEVAFALYLLKRFIPPAPEDSFVEAFALGGSSDVAGGGSSDEVGGGSRLAAAGGSREGSGDMGPLSVLAMLTSELPDRCPPLAAFGTVISSPLHNCSSSTRLLTWWYGIPCCSSKARSSYVGRSTSATLRTSVFFFFFFFFFSFLTDGAPASAASSSAMSRDDGGTGTSNRTGKPSMGRSKSAIIICAMSANSREPFPRHFPPFGPTLTSMCTIPSFDAAEITCCFWLPVRSRKAPSSPRCRIRASASSREIASWKYLTPPFERSYSSGLISMFGVIRYHSISFSYRSAVINIHGSL
mmetsp:Transcript_34991/g.91597  ORF Transcript_34991/g.91597 Transcript_34991/m.91597 type:complete len:317 (-) Transcript_34991:315-1265(-)